MVLFTIEKKVNFAITMDNLIIHNIFQMHLKDKKKLYLHEDQMLNINEELGNGIQIKASVLFEKHKFLDNQKNLIEEFIAELLDKLNEEDYDLEGVRGTFEVLLQNLNTKLK